MDEKELKVDQEALRWVVGQGADKETETVDYGGTIV